MKPSKPAALAKDKPKKVQRPNKHSKLRKRMQPQSNLVVQYAGLMEVDNIKNQDKSSSNLEPVQVKQRIF